MPKKPTKEQQEIEELKAQLASREEQLSHGQNELQAEARRAAEAAEQVEAQQALLRSEAEQAADLQRGLESQIAAARDEALQARGEAEQSSETRAQEAAAAAQALAERSELQSQLEELQRQRRDAESELQEMQQDATAASSHPTTMLDVAIGECEFATAFAYFVTVELQSTGERRSTDTARYSQRPVFSQPTFLLSLPDSPEQVLLVSAFISVPDPTALGAPPASRLLGEARVPVALEVPEGASASKRVVRSVSFTRMSSSYSGQEASEPLVVGRSTLVMQAKVLTPKEALQEDPRRAQGTLPDSMPLLDRSLWLVRRFQHCVRVLVHGLEGLQAPPPGDSAVVRLAARLLHPARGVLHESATPGAEVRAPGPASLGEQLRGRDPEIVGVPLGQEIVLPVAGGEDDASELTVQLAVELISLPGGGGGATTTSLLDLRWPLQVLPPLHPLHLHARASPEAGQVLSSARLASRPRPSMLVSLVREPAHEALDGLEDGASHAVEVRVHGVPLGRPLPEPVEGALVALCLDPAGSLDAGAAAKIPVVTYLYDQRQALSTCMDAYFKAAGAPSRPRYFLTPVAAAHSRSPEWSQFVARCLAPRGQLASLSLLVFEQGPGRGLDPDAPLGGPLLGFATLDAGALLGPEGGDPTTRSCSLDLRLLGAPGAACSLDADARVWPRGAAAGGAASPSAAAAGLSTLAQALQTAGPAATAAATAAPAGAGALSVASLAQGGGAAAALQHEAGEFRLNHELSVQLAREFNMRAAALKRAGEEIVTLRDQVRLLRAEGERLRARLEAEEEVEDRARNAPLPEGLDMLSGPELAGKLHRALERYRAEKAKTAEIGRHLEAALREAANGKALQRKMEELERAHLHQNRELQRLQEEAKKTDTYRQTAKTQEKVIAKLERILEGSLQEVQKMQKVRADVERMKADNARLRDKCARLAADSGAGAAGGDAEQLRRRVAEKELEASRLAASLDALRGERDLLRAEAERERQRADAAQRRADGAADAAQQRALDVETVAAAAERRSELGAMGLGGGGAAALAPVPEASELAGPQERALRAALQEAQQRYEAEEASAAEWERKCIAEEMRVVETEDKMRDDHEAAAAEAASLRAQIARRDARVGELESEIGAATEQAAQRAQEGRARQEAAAERAKAQAAGMLKRAISMAPPEELAKAIQDAEAAGVEGEAVEAADRALAERRAAADALRRAQQAGGAAELAQAIERASGAGVAESLLESAQAALAEKLRLAEHLKKVTGGRDVEELRRAIEEGEAAGAPQKELEAARQALQQRAKAADSLKRAERSQQIEDLRKAIEDVEASGNHVPELDQAKNALAVKERAVMALSSATLGGNEEAMKKAIEEAYNAGAGGRELEEARQALSQKKRVVDGLRKAEKFGSVDELKSAIAEAERAMEIGRELDDARAALSTKQKAVELLKRAERSGRIDELQRAIDEAVRVRADDRDVEEARGALTELQRQHALAELHKAQRIGDSEDLRKAIERCEAAGVRGKDLEDGWNILTNRTKASDSLKKAIKSGIIEDLKKAIDDSESLGMFNRDLDDARAAYALKTQALLAVRSALNIGDMEALRKAVQEAEVSNALGKELDDARATLTEQSKAQARAQDNLRKVLQLGKLADLEAAVQESERHGCTGKVMEDAWTVLGQKKNAMDRLDTMLKFGTPEDLYRALRDCESAGIVAEDLQEAYKQLTAITKGKRGFGKVAETVKKQDAKS